MSTTTGPKGVGDNLKEMLKWFEPTGGCGACNQKAKTLNRMGPNWAEIHIETVAGWLVTSANKKHRILAMIPGFETLSRVAAKELVREAIKRTREQAQK